MRAMSSRLVTAPAVASMMVLALGLAGCTSEGGAQVTQPPASTTSTASTATGSATSPSTDATVAADDTMVTYRFQDSSVPPRYHRSYTLTFDRQQAHIVVDSYGDILADQTVEMDPAAWEQVTSSLDTVGNLQVQEPAQGCTGGTGFVVQVDRGGSKLVDIDGYACGGVNSQASEQVSTWVGPVRSLFPSMDQLAPEGAAE